MRAERSSMDGTRSSLLSLYHLLDPEVLANPYPLYHRLRTEDPVHWDPYLHTWVVTRYVDVVTVLQHLSARRTPTPEQLTRMGLARLAPLAEVLVRQMLFLDGAAHARIRGLSVKAFTPRRVERPAFTHPGYYRSAPGRRAGAGIHGRDRRPG